MRPLFQNPSQKLGLKKGLRAIPLRIILPNIVTLLALALGMTSIRFTFEGARDEAVLAIILAAVLDGLDGRIARALKGTTRFGAELDSLADFVDFGVAPAIVLYVFVLREDQGFGWQGVGWQSFGWIVALLFVIACALRLARFNVMTEEATSTRWQDGFFVGMPAPAGAIVGLLPVYLQAAIGHMPHHPFVLILELAYVAAIAFFMASQLPFYSGKHIGRIPREYFAVVLFAIICVVLLLATFPMAMLMGVAVAYLLSLGFSLRHYHTLKAAQSEQDSADESLQAKEPSPHAQ